MGCENSLLKFTAFLEKCVRLSLQLLFCLIDTDTDCIMAALLVLPSRNPIGVVAYMEGCVDSSVARRDFPGRDVPTASKPLPASRRRTETAFAKRQGTNLTRPIESEA